MISADIELITSDEDSATFRVSWVVAGKHGEKWVEKRIEDEQQEGGL